ncbi:hypothetical protein EJB05_44205, partial [Eragrostis curvula]
MVLIAGPLVGGAIDVDERQGTPETVERALPVSLKTRLSSLRAVIFIRPLSHLAAIRHVERQECHYGRLLYCSSFTNVSHHHGICNPDILCWIIMVFSCYVLGVPCSCSYVLVVLCKD